MPLIATGVYKTLAIRKQSALNVKALAGPAGSAQALRRVTSTLDLSKASYSSAEILESQQKRDLRHGVKSVSGSISGELSPGSYQLPFESICRKISVVGGEMAANATISVVSTGASSANFIRTTGSYLTDGFKIGDVVNCLGFTTLAVGNNNHYCIIVALSALVMSVQSLTKLPFVAKVAGDNVSISAVGKKTWMPEKNQTRDYYTIEHWFSDISASEAFLDCVFTGCNVNLPPTGMATVEFPVMGLDMAIQPTQYFETPAVASKSGILAAVNGVCFVNGLVVGVITGLSIVLNGNYTTPGGVVGSNVDPDVYPGPIDVTGQVTILFVDTAMRNIFLNEEEVSIFGAFTASNSKNADFTSFVMSRVKYTGATKNDANAGLTLTMPYVALENTNGGAMAANLATTLSIQDSRFG